MQATAIDSHEIAELATVGMVLAHAEKYATMMTIFRDGSFDAYYDDKANDTRLVVRYRAGTTHITIKAMHGYDAERNMWTAEGRESRKEYDSKRGQKATIDSYKRLASALKGYYPNSLGMYRRATGEWYAR